MERESHSLSGFGKKNIQERLDLIHKLIPNLTADDISILEKGVSVVRLNSMVENVIGKYDLPYSVATNFIIDGKEMLVPVVTEESSIVAGMSKAAKMFRNSGGFTTETDAPLLMGQIQLLPIGLNQDSIKKVIDSNQETLITLANSLVPNMKARGGGVVEISLRSFGTTKVGEMCSVDILVNTGEVMGANMVNTICEGVAGCIEEITQARVGIKILSNLSDKRLSRSFCQIPINSPEMPSELAQKIVEAQVFADVDAYRAATHNKGIFNGIDALSIATGQDFRAIEAGGHAYAARSGVYKPLTNWYVNDGLLKGEIELPIAVGTVGGIVKYHKIVETSFKILGTNSSRELAGIMASVGLAQNFAALLALASKGIVASHMPLHARKA